MYKIRGQDGREYGPVTAEVVQRWIAERRAAAHTPVQVVGSTEWKTLGELPEFSAALGAGLEPPALPARGESASVRPGGCRTEKSLAILSLVLGILSLCTFFITGVPAIIIGYVARRRVRREPARYGGEGLALSGLILGSVGVALAFLLAVPAALVWPALANAKERAQRMSCRKNLKQIGLAARMFATEHGEALPRDFLSMSNQLILPHLLICPSDKRHPKMLTWADYAEHKVSYECLQPGAKTDDVLDQPIFRCPRHRHAVYGDGSLQDEPGAQGQDEPGRR